MMMYYDSLSDCLDDGKLGSLLGLDSTARAASRWTSFSRLKQQPGYVASLVSLTKNASSLSLFFALL